MEDSTVGLVLSMRSWVHLGLAGESVQEAHVWEHSILILWVTQLSKKFLDILLRNLISKIAEDVVKLSKHHGTIAVFVLLSGCGLTLSLKSSFAHIVVLGHTLLGFRFLVGGVPDGGILCSALNTTGDLLGRCSNRLDASISLRITCGQSRNHKS